MDKDTGHILYMDNLFTSVRLLNWLWVKGMGGCGTCHVKRGLQLFIQKAKKGSKAEIVSMGLHEQGNWVFSVHPGNNLCVTAWMD